MQTVTLRGVGKAMRALPLASHPSSWELSAALCLRLRETTGTTGLEACWAHPGLHVERTLPLSPGEVTSLPKSSVLPGPLDGSQELLVQGSGGLTAEGVGSLPTAAVTKHRQVCSFSKSVPAFGRSQVQISRCQEGQAPSKSCRGGPVLASSGFCGLLAGLGVLWLMIHRSSRSVLTWRSSLVCFCVPPLYQGHQS